MTTGGIKVVRPTVQKEKTSIQRTVTMTTEVAVWAIRKKIGIGEAVLSRNPTQGPEVGGTITREKDLILR